MLASSGMPRFLRPALGGVFPSCGAGRRIYGLRGYRRGNANRLLRGCESGFRRLGHRFLFFREERGGDTQGFYFLFQPGQFEFFLAENFVHIFHSSAPFVCASS